MSNRQKPILVTGSHRSGSTWIGKVISSSPSVRYVHEPFNLQKKFIVPPLKYWFEYINYQTDDDYQQLILAYLRSYFKAGFTYNPPTANPYQWVKESRSRLIRRTLIKDPIALFSAGWIYKKIDCDVIVCIRHPAAFIASLKVKDWSFPFGHFERQDTLMNNLLSPYASSINEILRNPGDIIAEGILLWNCLYSVVMKYEGKYEDQWYFVKHEDLSQDAGNEFVKIFDYLNLPLTNEVSQVIVNTSSGNSGSELHRDSRKNITSWKERLTSDEIERIKVGTQQIWTHYYTEDDWI